MEDFFELELADGDLYKGQLNEDRTEFKGDAVFIKKNKYIGIGQMVHSQFCGYGAMLDLVQQTIYLGQLKDSEKHGYGTITKYRAGADVKPLMDAAYKCTRETFCETVEHWVKKAKDAEQKARKKSNKVHAQMTQAADLKQVLKAIKMTPDESKAKRKRRIPKSQKIWNQYTGEFNEGKRTGWGVCLYKSMDQYSGYFQNDKMNGRGQYWYSQAGQSILYVGEFFENTFQGLGKMVFSDGSTYYGSFTNNAMASTRAVMTYSNGDRYKGEIQANKRHGDGTYWYESQALGQMSYEGSFKDDLRDGSGTLAQEQAPFLKYVGEFKDDKRCGKVDALSIGGQPAEGKQPDVIFKGRLDKDQNMDGLGTLEMVNEKVKYTGEFSENMFEGKGKIEYQETGAVFEGRFEKHFKQGPASFKLKTGETYNGVYAYNIAKTDHEDFGRRN